MICRDTSTFGGWMGQWVESGQMTNNLINLDLIEMILFFSGQMTNNLINLDLIVMIQFCLKIYDL